MNLYYIHNMNKIQLTITPQELEILRLKASSLGYNVTKYIKFLISRETHSFIERVPVYPLPKNVAKLAQTALDEHQAGKSIELKSVDDLDVL